MRILAALSILILLFSCSKEEAEYPFDQSPYVEFDDLVFFDNPDGIDTLELSFIVWDEEGDIGLENQLDDLMKPYQVYDIILDAGNNPVMLSGEFETPFFKSPILISPVNGETSYLFFPEMSELYSEEDNRPVYSCEDYEIIETEAQADTFLVVRNKFYNNMHIDFLDEAGLSYDFQTIFNTTNCAVGEFDARLFPIGGVGFLNPAKSEVFSVERHTPNSWRVTYSLSSLLWKLAFQNRQFEIQFQVNDRELNESNIVSSSLVTLEQITE